MEPDMDVLNPALSKRLIAGLEYAAPEYAAGVT
jgi:hypothetical protein